MIREHLALPTTRQPPIVNGDIEAHRRQHELRVPSYPLRLVGTPGGTPQVKSWSRYVKHERFTTTSPADQLMTSVSRSRKRKNACSRALASPGLLRTERGAGK